MGISRKRVSSESFDAMWSFLQMGGQRANYQALKENCLKLRDMMMQKTAGQRANKPNDLDFDDLDQTKNIIVLEAMCLVLDADKAETMGGNEADGHNKDNGIILISGEDHNG